MRKKFTVMTMVMALVLSTMSMALADDALFDADDSIADDDATLTVACSTDMSDIAGVTGANLQTAQDPSNDVYRVPWDFGDIDATTMVSFEWSRDGEEYFGGDLTTDGSDGNWYPAYPGTHAEQSIVYTFADGSTATAVASFDAANFCITGVEWTQQVAVLDVSIDFSGTESLTPGEAGEYTVEVTNEESSTVDLTGWQLGLEVEDVDDAGDVTLEFCDSDHANCSNIDEFDDIDVELVGNVLQVRGSVENELAPNSTDTQYFTASFAKTGDYTGTAHVLQMGN